MPRAIGFMLLLMLLLSGLGQPVEAKFLRHGVRPPAGDTPGFQRAPARGIILRIRPPKASPEDAVRPRRQG
ncbi:MAG TPA: hypothetical protein VK090_06380, partial [Paracoccaceae bacterium]|nr:hypothetical protein [Paracoccaceae bacterium]